jgi:hypothetical protein
LLISQRFPAITICERQWTGRKARRDRGLAAAPEFIQELGHGFPRMVSPYRSRSFLHPASVHAAGDQLRTVVLCRADDRPAFGARRCAVPKPRLKTFNATVHVTRVEEWCVEAETSDEARELLAAGAGHRCQVGDCVNIEVDRVED